MTNKQFKIIKVSDTWSSSKLRDLVETILNQKSLEGYEVVSVSFGVNHFWIPTAYITLAWEE